MAVREVPKSYEYTCDSCGQAHRQEHAHGHYTNSVPPKWTRMVVHYGPDNGGTHTKPSLDKLYCPACWAHVQGVD